ncbi:Acetylglutamate kinase [bioreactor metagenome]|uniref:Acetylglutamate kinase n=2 Tax=root TaxID=1 RepID=A0AB33HSS8_9CHLR|nr:MULTISPECIES: acetylglutamate kinase [Dehalococcoides]MEA4879056.1 acetylglutamate kinase [Dehalococcoides mccartyi]POZ59672.1 Acetylglutamate kinase [Dehalococcoides mccartyi]BAZ97667.1 acetylglutamate kinase [Dehalococcoides mccartyi]
MNVSQVSNHIVVIKLGGSVLSSKDTSLKDIATLKQLGLKPVLIHGGASTVSDWSAKLGLETRLVNGERVTDDPTLDVVAAVLTGLVNKEIVAALLDMGVQAAGISGVDGATITGQMRATETGYLGDVTAVNTGLINALLDKDITPVISPVSFHHAKRPSGSRRLININGDPAAGEIAAALQAERLVFMTDVPAVKGKNGEALGEISAEHAAELLSSGTASGGMIPKLRSCLKATLAGASACIIDGRIPHMLVRELTEGNCGTTIIGQHLRRS